MSFSIQNLIYNKWRMLDFSGKVIISELVFKENGQVIGSKHENESYWKLSSNKLFIYSRNGKITSEFDTVYQLSQDYFQLLGKFVLGSNSEKTYYFILESISTINDIYSELAFDISIGKNTKKLIIQFNSAGTPYLGDTHSREFNSLVALMGHDIVRISQTKPAFWYTNKINDLIKILSACICLNYNKVFILGSSAGGYASLLLGELLSSFYPQIVFKTFSINAKTSFDKVHLDYVKKNFPPSFLSSEQMDEVRLSQRDISDTNIANYLKVKKDNIQHEVFYDIGNPIENYYYGLISNFKRVHLNAYNLGYNHGDGCVAIGDSDKFRNIVLNSVNLVESINC